MKYWIWGLGRWAEIASKFIGSDNIEGYVDLLPPMNIFNGKKVISIDDYIESYKSCEKCMLVIASEFTAREKEEYIVQKNTRYVIIDIEDIPVYGIEGRTIYPSCEELLREADLKNNASILIIGNNSLNFFIKEVINSKTVNCVIEEFVTATDIDYSKYETIVINCNRKKSNIRSQLQLKKIEYLDFTTSERLEERFKHYELKKYKDIHKGKRIFIIGNGPSLRIEDLNTLHENREICFGFNKIFKLYDKTSWRPNYIGIADHRVILEIEDIIDELSECIFCTDAYLSDNRLINIGKIDGIEYLHIGHEEYGEHNPEFSENITSNTWMGYSVAYDIGIQVAVYMGAKEIILLGMDNTFNGKVYDQANHGIEDYISKEKKYLYEDAKSETNKIEKAFEYAEAFSRTRDFRIYNATRGGALEIFERVKFDDLFI